MSACEYGCSLTLGPNPSCPEHGQGGALEVHQWPRLIGGIRDGMLLPPETLDAPPPTIATAGNLGGPLTVDYPKHRLRVASSTDARATAIIVDAYVIEGHPNPDAAVLGALLDRAMKCDELERELERVDATVQEIQSDLASVFDGEGPRDPSRQGDHDDPQNLIA